MDECNIPDELLYDICTRIVDKFGNIPFKHRNIRITKKLIATTLEILNMEANNELPQNCRNLVKEKTPDGLDKRIKVKLNTNLRTGNIISDILKEIGVVEVFKRESTTTGRIIYWTKSNVNW